MTSTPAPRLVRVTRSSYAVIRNGKEVARVERGQFRWTVTRTGAAIHSASEPTLAAAKAAVDRLFTKAAS